MSQTFRGEFGGRSLKSDTGPMGRIIPRTAHSHTPIRHSAMHRKRANPRVRSGKRAAGAARLQVGYQPPAGHRRIDDCNPLSLGLDDQTLEYTIARKRNYVAGLQAQHLLIALEASAGTETPVEGISVAGYRVARPSSLRADQHPYCRRHGQGACQGMDRGDPARVCDNVQASSAAGGCKG